MLRILTVVPKKIILPLQDPIILLPLDHTIHPLQDPIILAAAAEVVVVVQVVADLEEVLLGDVEINHNNFLKCDTLPYLLVVC